MRRGDERNGQLHGFAQILGGGALTIMLSSLGDADVVEYPDFFEPWQDAAPDFVTLDFTGIDKPGLTHVTNQYLDLGAYFPDWNDILQTGKSFPNDGWGMRGYIFPPGLIHIVFEMPRNSLAAHFPGCLYIELYRDGELIHSGQNECPQSGQGFLGLVSNEPFNGALLARVTGDPFVDDIYVGVPYIPGDLTGDAWVGPADLGELLASWGPCLPPPPDGDLCLADVFPPSGAGGGDGEIGAGDLAILLANWSADCNANDRADSLDIQLYDADCNANGIPDDCDIKSGASDDCNGNGRPDECDLVQRISTYAHDDGEQDSAFGIDHAMDMIWMNSFTVQKGAETIVAVEVSWGYGPADIAIWDDPNNDGNPDDAVLLAVVEDVPVRFPDHDPFRVIEIPPTYVGEPGEWFFVGARVFDPDEEFPAGFDDDAIANQSWFTAGALDDFTFTPSLMNPPYPGAWLIRALTEQSGDADGDGQLDECEGDGEGQAIGNPAIAD